ncbi:MAG: DoxX family protein [Bacteroidota bacterium]
MNANKIIYWVATGIMCLIFLFSAIMYFSQYEMISEAYKQLGFPTWIIYPSATLKILGVVAVLSKQSKLLKEWAYAGFFFDAALAFAAHYFAADGAGGMAAIALVAVVVSRFMDGKLYP